MPRELYVQLHQRIHDMRHDRALPRAVTRLPIELAIVALEQVCLVQDKADLAQQVKGRWRGGIG